jgi:hypothetical protein
MNYTHINPTFTTHYNQGYTAKSIDYDALYKEAFAQIGERTTITLSTGRVSCQSGMHNARWNKTVRIKHSKNFTPIQHRDVFAPFEDLKTTIREAGGWDAYWGTVRTNAVEDYLHWMRLAEQEARRATDGVLQSAIGFEPTDASKLHHDIPPFVPQPKPQVCIDFGFEPTEASE